MSTVTRREGGNRVCQTRETEPVFTAEEHLQAQRAIEERARAFWLADGRETGRALQHWLRAEAEVLAEFCAARTTPSSPVPVPRNAKSGGRRIFAPMPFAWQLANGPETELTAALGSRL